MSSRVAPVVSFLARRLRLGILVVVGVSVLIFTLARVMPGDPARLALGPAASADQVVAMRAQLGLDRPILAQYGIFLEHALRFDFGQSLYTSHPVTDDIVETFPATLELVLVAGTIMGVVGIGVGIASARFKDGGIDNVSRLFSLLCVAMPNFVWALLMMLFASFWLGVLPIAGRLSENLTPPPLVTGLLTVDSLIAGLTVPGADIGAAVARHAIDAGERDADMLQRVVALLKERGRQGEAGELLHKLRQPAALLLSTVVRLSADMYPIL